MKQMKEVEVPEEEAPRRRFEFWMTAVAEADLVASIRSQILKDASKKANFPGFRKGQVPPYALPQIMQFSVQESIIKTVESALEAYGLESLPGSDGQVTIHENVEAIARQYKTGTGIPFTATLQAAYGTQDNDDVDNVVVDVASKTVSEE
jgi:FKBP-type peptidyl-prolyl cis-trans isomerase (trigger factor)